MVLSTGPPGRARSAILRPVRAWTSRGVGVRIANCSVVVPPFGQMFLALKRGVRAQVRAGVELRLAVRGEVDVVADAERVRPEDVLAVGLDGLAATDGGEGE